MVARPGQTGKTSNELVSRLLFVFIGLVIFRLGSFVPVPGINTDVLEKMFSEQSGNVLGMFNMFSGGALSRASILALGIMPYISSAIIIQLMAVINPTLAELKKEGESGRRTLTKYTRWGTLFLGLLQSVGIAYGLPNMIPGLVDEVNMGWQFMVVATVSLTAGTMFLMWLGEQITERGVGNGISLLIFAGIVAGLPHALAATFEQVRQEELSIIGILIIALVVVSVTYFVVFVERGQRRIPINYAKRQNGNRFYNPPSTHLPLKLNMSGVIPAIFASSIILFPGTIVAWLGNGQGPVANFLQEVSMLLQPGQPLYEILYAVAIVFFCFFYTAMVFNPREIADNLKKSGAFISGIRPGEQTAKHIDKVMTRLTLAGSVYMVFVCLVPQLLMTWFNVQFYFGGTSLLIIVVVIMDFIAQLQSHMATYQYGDALKKANLINFGR
ncbi:preprotein translocase subunit SecY [Succinimonas amylolytica]|jgi:preprotein translocase subunit SecY|uniref:preprotein translocase subunit SecY n=1 Tax=Succinimonas amylolytica TaxID=83769 RepID=UPI0003625EFE|nr:preprotein translocase subunit SecY [Succinimonas amylolytica]